jgi:acetoin utilization deacetylase AcuC-like enzyme
MEVIVKVVFHENFYGVYTSDPAASAGRMEAVIEVIKPNVEFVTAEPASEEDIAVVHTKSHIEYVKGVGLYPIAALAAGGGVQAATLGLYEPSFGLIRPPGHHASSGSSWGFCFFNNMAIALERLKRDKKIENAYVLDIDLHFGDGTVNILKNRDYVTIHNVEANYRDAFMDEIAYAMDHCKADMIGISAGFDNHEEDWGGTLTTDDYREIGRMVKKAAIRCGGGCFGILEGGYNHQVLGHNVMALIEGLSGESS